MAMDRQRGVAGPEESGARSNLGPSAMPSSTTGALGALCQCTRRNWSGHVVRVATLPSPLPPIDGLMAATAKVHRLTLVTRNVADVQGAGVDIVNPFEPR